MPDVYPAIVREIPIIRTVIQQPPSPSTLINYYPFITPTPPSDMSNLGITNITVPCTANISPKPTPSYTPLTEPSPVAPDLLGTTSIDVGVRKTP